MPVPFSSAEIAVCQSWERGPIGSSIRPAMFNWRRSMAVLKFAPLRFKNFFTKVSTFFGRKSGWKGTGISPVIAFLADFDRPWNTAAAAKLMIDLATDISEPFGSSMLDTSCLEFAERLESLLEAELDDELDELLEESYVRDL